MNATELKEKQRHLRAGFPESLSLRVHRAISWLKKAETTEDQDMQFIALWIAFNASYAKEVNYQTGDKFTFRQFFFEILKLDSEQRIYQMVWQKFSNTLRLLLGNKYIFQPYWDYHNGLISKTAWEIDFKEANDAVRDALQQQNTAKLLDLIFQRIYTLRNQIIHGGATWNSAVNRQQLKDCSAFLTAFLPIIIELQMDHSEYDWGKAFYPLVTDD